MRLSPFGSLRHGGMTLIELIVFVVIVSVALVGILTVLNATVFRSADPIVQKQAQAFAEGLLEEIQTGYFAYCDGADSQLKYATAAASCASAPGDTYGPESGETRPYDTVKDYASAAGAATSLDSVLPNESGISVPPGYSASVTIAPVALGDISLASGDALLIRVTVAAPGVTAVAEGFKTRQVPQ